MSMLSLSRRFWKTVNFSTPSPKPNMSRRSKRKINDGDGSAVVVKRIKVEAPPPPPELCTDVWSLIFDFLPPRRRFGLEVVCKAWQRHLHIYLGHLQRINYSKCCRNNYPSPGRLRYILKWCVRLSELVIDPGFLGLLDETEKLPLQLRIPNQFMGCHHNVSERNPHVVTHATLAWKARTELTLSRFPNLKKASIVYWGHSKPEMVSYDFIEALPGSCNEIELSKLDLDVVCTRPFGPRLQNITTLEFNDLSFHIHAGRENLFDCVTKLRELHLDNVRFIGDDARIRLKLPATLEVLSIRKSGTGTGLGAVPNFWDSLWTHNTNIKTLTLGRHLHQDITMANLIKCCSINPKIEKLHLWGYFPAESEANGMSLLQLVDACPNLTSLHANTRFIYSVFTGFIDDSGHWLPAVVSRLKSWKPTVMRAFVHCISTEWSQHVYSHYNLDRPKEQIDKAIVQLIDDYLLPQYPADKHGFIKKLLALIHLKEYQRALDWYSHIVDNLFVSPSTQVTFIRESDSLYHCQFACLIGLDQIDRLVQEVVNLKSKIRMTYFNVIWANPEQEKRFKSRLVELYPEGGF